MGGAHLESRTSIGGRDSQREVLGPEETKSKRGEREGGRDTPAMLIQAEPQYAERIGGRVGSQSAENFKRNCPL